MLDQETKRKIDNARDILVGKVPDPKSQVEQITIALIYKFMDDMDKESEEWGGKSTFFAGEYEKYAWSKIFDPRLGGFDLIGLYSDAIVKMNQNPNVPQLFRDIFKNAYLPYRDPETLKSFLKEINEFTYDHSERLGDAFEYLLSVMDSQGDAGQFRTPRHIIDFIVEIVSPKKNETVLDPACGTAGFLISSYRHILKSNTKDRNGDTLTPNEKKRLLNNFTGYDISPDMVRLSLVNMYLHGFSDPKITEYDTLTSEERWNETSDVVLANPPFMTPKGGIRPHKRFSIQAKRSEVLFVDYIAEHLNPNGRAGVIVPEGIIFQSQTAYKNLRKMLVENYLWAVVSLPAGLFNPYSGVTTSILLMDKTLTKKTNKILFVKIDNDGFDLGAQRRPIDKNDLPKTLDYLKVYKKAVIAGKVVDNTDFAHVVEKTKIAESKDWNLSGERYRDRSDLRTLNYTLVELGKIMLVNRRTVNPEANYGDNDFVYIDITSVENGTGIVSFENLIKGTEAPSRARRVVKKGDILLSTVRPNLKAFAYLSEVPKNAIASTGFAVLTATSKVVPQFVYYQLLGDRLQKQMIGRMGKGSYPSINQKDVQELLIPLPPLDVQQTIVAEIDGYQKIINGARQVVGNYKPTIKIDPDWKMVTLESIIDLLTDYHANGSYQVLKKNVTLKDNKDYAWMIRSTDFENNFQNDFKYIDEHAYEFLSKSKVYSGDLIINKIGNVGKVYLVPELKQPCSLAMNQFLIRINGQKSSNKFAYYILNAPFGQREIRRSSRGATTKTIDKKGVKSIQVALPPLSIQEEIVAQIEAEQEMVNGNKKLIEIYEQKIKDKISEVWGK